MADSKPLTVGIIFLGNSDGMTMGMRPFEIKIFMASFYERKLTNMERIMNKTAVLGVLFCLIGHGALLLAADPATKGTAVQSVKVISEDGKLLLDPLKVTRPPLWLKNNKNQVVTTWVAIRLFR